MKPEIIIAVSVLSGVAVLLVLLQTVFFAARKKLETHIRNNFAPKDLAGATTRANFLGELSKGGRQMRGNGALVLTKDALHFIRAVPFKEYEIPIRSIIKISMPGSFNGKSVLAKLLCIHYQTKSGTDAMAWALKNPENWKKTIERLRAGA